MKIYSLDRRPPWRWILYKNYRGSVSVFVVDNDAHVRESFLVTKLPSLGNSRKVQTLDVGELPISDRLQIVPVLVMEKAYFHDV